jgi:putative ABC transport system substrate-binding protein
MPPFDRSRRSFLAGLAAAALAGSQPARGAAEVKTVGYLSGGQGPEWLAKVLASRGYVEGRNLRIVTRIPPDWEADTLAKAARELVAERPDALYAIMANRVGALAGATRTIPIVTGGVPDPVGGGFAKSLRRPGGNVTGLSFGLPETAEIVIALLKSMRPGLARVGGVFGKGMPTAHMGPWWVEASRNAGLAWSAANLGTVEEAERFLTPMAGQAVFVAPQKDPAFAPRILSIATRLRIMTLGSVQGGALMTYGMDFENGAERIGWLLDRVLRGTNPAEIPFELPDRPTFEWNRTTAKAIGIQIPADILLRVTTFVD